jgi:ribosomal protein L11 methyltransferase
VEISTTEIAEDWHERWKLFHRPILVSPPVECLQTLPALHVRPPWEAPRERSGAPVRELVIDPGQAFGTGAHATTRLCLELLLELTCSEAAAGPLLDVGTGSGVLAIAAAALGYEPVLGLDHERESVHAASENALVNGVQIEVRRFELRSQALPWMDGHAAPDAPLVVLANLLRPLLLELAATMPSAPAHMIISGLLCEEADEVAAAFVQRLGMHERLRRSGGEWAAVWLTAAGGSTSPG